MPGNNVYAPKSYPHLAGNTPELSHPEKTFRGLVEWSYDREREIRFCYRQVNFMSYIRWIEPPARPRY